MAEGSCSFCQIFSECALPLEMVDETFAVWVIASVFENSGTATVYQAPASMVVFLVCGKETTDTQVVYEKVTCRPVRGREEDHLSNFGDVHAGNRTNKGK